MVIQSELESNGVARTLHLLTANRALAILAGAMASACVLILHDDGWAGELVGVLAACSILSLFIAVSMKRAGEQTGGAVLFVTWTGCLSFFLLLPSIAIAVVNVQAFTIHPCASGEQDYGDFGYRCIPNPDALRSFDVLSWITVVALISILMLSVGALRALGRSAN